MPADLLDALVERLLRSRSGDIRCSKNHLDLMRVRITLDRSIAGALTLMGLLSTFRPLWAAAASEAAFAFVKMTVATPRLWPFGPYVRRTFLTGPTLLAKYSYRESR